MIISVETAGIILRSDIAVWHKPEKSNNNKIKLLRVCKFKKKGIGKKIRFPRHDNHYHYFEFTF